MSPTSKRLKIVCFTSMAYGLLLLCYGIFLIVQHAGDAPAYLTAAGGLGTSALGVTAARLANVPSNARRIMTLAAVALALALVAGISCAVMPLEAAPTPLIANALACACALTTIVCAHAVRRDAESI